MILYLSLIPLALAVSHYFGLICDFKDKSHFEALKSFAAGFSVAYVFLLLIPELSRSEHINGVNIETMSIVLIGFVAFHLSHKFVFKARDLRRKVTLLDEIHLVTAAIYNFLIAFSLVELVRMDLLRGLFVVAVIIMHTILSELTQAEMQHNITNKTKFVYIVAATLLGGTLGLFEALSMTASNIIFAFTAGAIIYIAIREEIPSDATGQPIYFVFGTLTLLATFSVLL